MNGMLYIGFYSLAFITAIVLMIRFGRINKYPLIPWIFTLSITCLAFMIGTRLIMISGQDLSIIQQSFTKNFLGGMVVSIIVFAICVKTFRLPAESFNALAIPLPLSLSIQKIGCCFTGCCFGTPSGNWPGIQWEQGSVPFAIYHARGWTESITPALHASQYYQLFFYAIITLILVYLTSQNKKGLFLISIGLVLLGRFLLEFTMDNHSLPGWLTDEWYSLKLIQWLLLIFSCIAFLIYLRITGKVRQTDIVHLRVSRQHRFAFISSIILAIAIVPASKLGSPSEVVVMAFIFFILASMIILKFISMNKQFSRVTNLLWSMFVIIILTSQNVEFEEVKGKKVDSYTSVSVSGGFAEFSQHEVVQITIPNYVPAGYYYDSCSGQYVYSPGYTNYSYDYVDRQIKQEFESGSIGIHRYKRIEQDKSLMYGLNLTGGIQHSTVLDDGVVTKKRKLNLFSFSPYFNIDENYFGFGLGFHTGNLWQSFKISSEDTRHTIGFRPYLAMRFGLKRVIYAEASMNDKIASVGPPVFRYGIGTGFGKEWFNLSTGIHMGDYDVEGIYASSLIHFHKFILEPTVYFPSFKKSKDLRYQNYSLGLQYKF
jgi:hypothetical protein